MYNPDSWRRGTESEGGSVEETAWKGEQWTLQQAPREVSLQLPQKDYPVREGGAEAGRDSQCRNGLIVLRLGCCWDLFLFS